MDLLRSSAVAIAAIPAVAATGVVAQPVEPNVATNWVRQLSRSGVQSSRGSYNTSFEINSSRYEIDGTIPCVERSPSCIVKYLGDSVGSNRYAKSADATPYFSFEDHISSAFDVACSTFDAVDDADASMIIDAMAFADVIDKVEWRPSVWKEGDEIVFEWISEGRHAVVSIEGDGTIAYTMLKEGQFVSGEAVGASVGSFPDDLQEYINSIA